MIQLIPAIDLIDGRCVRLSQGDYGQKKVYDGDPADLAARYADCGVRRLHLVDLDGAKAGTGVSNVAKIGSPPTLHMCWSAFSVSATSPPSSGVQGGALL